MFRLKLLTIAMLAALAGPTFAAGLTAGSLGGSTSGTTGGGGGGGGKLETGGIGGKGSGSGSSTGTGSGQTGNTPSTGEVTCTGKEFDLEDDPDWNNLYPITWGGSKLGNNNAQPPWMAMPRICYCESRWFGQKLPGLGVTYWEPTTLVEIQRDPGCSPTQGGKVILKGYGSLLSANNEARDEQQYNRMQIHEYIFPILGVLNIFSGISCMNPSSFALRSLTETSDAWNMGSGWQAALSPRSALIATPVAQAACGIEAAALYARGWHMNFMDWCIGGWGSSAVLGGDVNVADSSWHSNGLSYFKYRQMQAAYGQIWTSIGPGARCNSFPSPIMDKAQVRYNQVGPWPLYGKPIRMGDLPIGVNTTVTNSPVKDSTDVVIWEGKQCCIRF